MSSLVNSIQATTHQISSFSRDGALKISQLLSSEAISKISELVAEKNEVKGHPGFQKATRDMGPEDKILNDLCSCSNLKNLLSKITGKKLIFAQALGNQLTPNEKGTHWHYGLQSFSYIDVRNFGCTVWVPLVDTIKDGQKGSLCWISEEIMSARERVKLIDFAFKNNYSGSELAEKAKELNLPLSLLNKIEIDLFQKNRVEDDFHKGDVLLFNRWVFHRTSPFQEGPIPNRPALILRFIDQDSIYRPKFFEFLKDYYRSTWPAGYNISENIGYRYKDISDGDKIIQSKHPHFLMS